MTKTFRIRPIIGYREFVGFDGLVFALTIQATFLMATFAVAEQRHVQRCSLASKGARRSTERRRSRRIPVHENFDAANSRQGQHTLAES
ncbi:hypothetical protein [Bradyrhizobium forestalis]|uniref:hypothetical protein n=1 Tax=Bradyrhizobium forestalis TaxID=1419263 RepID=UPI0011AF25AD|nr:hypothetical protein [Bradyrhizobium forestalis]